MVARAFVAKRPVDDDEVGWRSHWKDLAGRGHAEEELAARGKEFFSDQNGERGANCTTHDTVFVPLVMKDVEIGVVAGPAGMTVGTSPGTQVPHDIAIRIEQADFRNGHGGQAFLPTRFAQ